MAFKEVDIKSLNFNPFTKIGSEWMLITAGDESGCNTMTASWGGLGVLWGKNVATCYIRPQRYTKKFVDANDTFTLSLYGPSTSRHSLSAVPSQAATATRSKKLDLPRISQTEQLLSRRPAWSSCAGSSTRMRSSRRTLSQKRTMENGIRRKIITLFILQKSQKFS